MQYKLFNVDAFSLFEGWAVVSDTKAALWTDGRYFLQAEMQLDCNWILQKQGKIATQSVFSDCMWFYGNNITECCVFSGDTGRQTINGTNSVLSLSILCEEGLSGSH